jgi:hypothetical protein
MDLLDKLVEKRATAGESMTAICDLAATEERDLTDTEDENLKALREDADRLDIRCQELREIQLGASPATRPRWTSSTAIRAPLRSLAWSSRSTSRSSPRSWHAQGGHSPTCARRCHFLRMGCP